MFNKVFSKGYAGLRNWLLQRFTALVMAVYSVMLAVMLLVQQPWQQASWKQMFSPLWMRVFTLLFMFSLIAHAWLGVRDIFKDYVPALRLRKVLQVVVAGALVAYGVWTVNILWSV